jgi:hypothetical protein
LRALRAPGARLGRRSGTAEQVSENRVSIVASAVPSTPTRSSTNQTNAPAGGAVRKKRSVPPIHCRSRGLSPRAPSPRGTTLRHQSAHATHGVFRPGSGRVQGHAPQQRHGRKDFLASRATLRKDRAGVLASPRDLRSGSPRFPTRRGLDCVRAAFASHARHDYGAASPPRARSAHPLLQRVHQVADGASFDRRRIPEQALLVARPHQRDGVCVVRPDPRV